jgi:hypothetical protein
MSKFSRLRNPIIMLLVASCLSNTGMAQPLVCERLFASSPAIPFTSGPTWKLAPAEQNKVFNSEFKAQYKELDDFFSRTSLLFLKRGIRDGIERICDNNNGCTQKDLAILTAEAVADTIPRIQKIKLTASQVRGMAILFAVAGGIAYGADFAESHFLSHASPVANVITMVTALLITNWLKPISDTAANSAMISYRVSDGKGLRRGDKNIFRYAASYRRRADKITSLELDGLNRMIGLTGLAEQYFGAAAGYLDNADLNRSPNDLDLKKAASKIALFAIKLRMWFPETSPDDPDLTRSIQMTFLNFTPDRDLRARLGPLVLQQISENDSLFSQSKPTEKTYTAAVHLWLNY